MKKLDFAIVFENVPSFSFFFYLLIKQKRTTLVRGGTAKGAALQDELVDLLYELGNNETLRSLDVSGHIAGDAGAAALAKGI